MISVVIVNWNSGAQLLDVVLSLNLHHKGMVRSLIIVDNASSDGSLDRVEVLDSLPFKLILIRNSENCGFGAACNQGARVAECDHLLFLNPDAKLFADSLTNLLAYMQDLTNSTVGICGVQLVDESGSVSRSCTRFPTPWGFAGHAIGLNRLIPRYGHFMDEWAHDITCDVDHVIGAFFLVRRELFESLGGFDERFFLYLEDLDFSYRASKAGWRSVYLADVQAFHTGGGTSNQVKARRLFYSLRSRLLYSFKHFSFVGSILVLLTTLLVEPLSRSALALAKRSWPTFKETWQGYGMLLRWLPQWWFKGVTR